eukprot:snap_masked-scaffold_2-processed-gene-10.33-mRNA-1 protein AED:1.00 eAED:1.00 QI:0/0/0/0/1/1/2/0/84
MAKYNDFLVSMIGQTCSNSQGSWLQLETIFTLKKIQEDLAFEYAVHPQKPCSIDNCLRICFASVKLELGKNYLSYIIFEILFLL